MADIEWTGDSMARLIWRCRECGATGEAESKLGIATGEDHRLNCPGGLHPAIVQLDRIKTDLSMRFMRAVRAGDDALRDELLAKIDKVEAVEEIVKEMYT